MLELFSQLQACVAARADGYDVGDMLKLIAAAKDVLGERLDVLTEVSEFLDNYVDVNDGDYGEPTPNRAMSLKSRVDDLLDA